MIIAVTLVDNATYLEDVNTHIDHNLLSACNRGEESSQHKLYQICYGTLYTVCQRYAPDEDQIVTLLNTAFLKIVKGLHTFNPNGKVPFVAWIRRIAINTAIDAHRRSKKYRSTIIYPDPDQHTFDERQVDYNQAAQQFDVQQLLAMIRKLPPMTAKVFNLFAIDGYAHKEIGEMLSISVGTSKWHLSEARKKLQILLCKSIENETVTVMSKKQRQENHIKSNSYGPA
ncbi:MAG: sigma-70 family RNA polymerase sigma factor [Saprospiraceae bacterium]|nr:sigma-70 family RNA polymerase sigma factor [Saprospiraceae bacterium]